MILYAGDSCFGIHLRQIRKQRKLSQRALAKAAGVSVYMLRGWERGTLELRLDEGRLMCLCSALGITLDNLFVKQQ